MLTHLVNRCLTVICILHCLRTEAYSTHDGVTKVFRTSGRKGVLKLIKDPSFLMTPSQRTSVANGNSILTENVGFAGDEQLTSSSRGSRKYVFPNILDFHEVRRRVIHAGNVSNMARPANRLRISSLSGEDRLNDQESRTAEGFSGESGDCSDDTSSTNAEENEATFTNGVKEINKLSKAPHPLLVDNLTSDETGESGIGDAEGSRKFQGSIDLNYLQHLFRNKNITQFENELFQLHNAAYLKELQKKLFKEERLKLRQGKYSIDDKALLHAIKTTVENAAEDMRFKIQFPLFYHASGLITLPQDDIVEPFEAWYAGDLNMSRIDYYYGMDKTYQRGDIGRHGVVVKVVPAHWSKSGNLDKTIMSCWYKEESRLTKRRAQTVVPLNVKKFTFAGKEFFNGVPAFKFVYCRRFGGKNNTYKLYVSTTKPYRPLRYEMVGYDHLLRSHYDHYILDYITFDKWDFDYTILQIPKEYKCHKKLASLKSHFEANPMWEFLHDEHTGNRELELKHAFRKYKNMHGKRYKGRRENSKRRNIFRHSRRFVHSHNRARHGYTLEVNHLADLEDYEFEFMKGMPDMDSPKVQKEINDIPVLRLEIPTKPVPENLDWRDYGAVRPVHSQTSCASCWAFSAVGAIEGANAIQNKAFEELSVQQLIDCSWGYNNNGCRGGWSWRAMNFVKDHGLATRKSYGRYLGQEGYCHCDERDNCSRVANITIRTIERHDPEKLRLAIARFGPGSTSVNSDRKTFKFYSSGIYNDQKCSNKTNHAVLVVGYGKQSDGSFWLIKNSWGPLWGDDGYMKISVDNELCGLLRNGALMVSFKDWKETEQTRFPFESMSKVNSSTSSSQNVRSMNKHTDLETLDLSAVPIHVLQYQTREGAATS